MNVAEKKANSINSKAVQVGYLELTMQNSLRHATCLAQKIENKPEIVAFIAKGSFQIGETIANYFDVPLIEVTAARSGNKLKAIIRPFLRLIPKPLKVYLRKLEIKVGLQKKKNRANGKCFRCKWINSKCV